MRAVALVVAVSTVLIGAMAFALTRDDGTGVVAPETVPVANAADTPVSASSTGAGTTSDTTPTTTIPPSPTDVTANPLPTNSGEGRRMVFSLSSQRIWWVESDGSVIRTGLGSGQPDSPVPGTYAVYSRTEFATGLDGSKMQKFVRFTKGPNGWAIGFHSIPTVAGVPVQTEAELGQPLSHGCIRQGEADADFTWQFAPVGSTVVVVA
jgi:lipoprotein-anchoring transpeptidase ErfK/SrfK